MLYQSLFLSDTHLGTRGCQAEMLLEFLAEHEAQSIYLVGDIVDGWQLQRDWHWPQAHNDVVQALLAKAHDGTRIIFIPGNHDEWLPVSGDAWRSVRLYRGERQVVGSSGR